MIVRKQNLGQGFHILNCFKKRKHFINFLRKHLVQQKNDNEARELSDEYENLWAMILDKRYRGVQEVLRSSHLQLTSATCSLTQAEIRFNFDTSVDRSIVEIFFGGVLYGPDG